MEIPSFDGTTGILNMVQNIKRHCGKGRNFEPYTLIPNQVEDDKLLLINMRQNAIKLIKRSIRDD